MSTNSGSTTIYGDIGNFVGAKINALSPLINLAGNDLRIWDGSEFDGVYHTLATLPSTVQYHSSSLELGGLTLSPGIYNNFNSPAQLNGTLTLDFGANPDSIFVFQLGLTTANNSVINVINGGAHSGVYWVGGVGLGAGTEFAGNILTPAYIFMEPNVNICGRVLARNQITLNTNVISNDCSRFGGRNDFGSMGFSGGQLSGIIAAVPEPEPYAMMLAGSALLGLMARRRKQQALA
ncbi:MAG: ice-binding family protein [Gallionella sp.]